MSNIIRTECISKWPMSIGNATFLFKLIEIVSFFFFFLNIRM